MIRDRPDLLFVPSHVIPLAHPRRTVVTIHDLGYLRYRSAYPPSTWLYLYLSTIWNARVATRVVVDSADTGRAVEQVLRVPPDRIDIVHLGVEARFFEADNEPGRSIGADDAGDTSDDYILFVGTRQPRKNLARLLRAYARARSEKSMPRLALVGGFGHRASDLIATAHRLGIADRVDVLGYVDTADLPSIYRRARALAFVSLHEGFGLPMLEAMASGTPVLAGTNSAMPEVAGDAALLVDADDEAAIAAGLIQISIDGALRARLRASGRVRARQFTWDATARGVRGSIERALAT
jgi:glycosyltransferase involved in cell wall biosynthesis